MLCALGRLRDTCLSAGLEEGPARSNDLGRRSDASIVDLFMLEHVGVCMGQEVKGYLRVLCYLGCGHIEGYVVA